MARDFWGHALCDCGWTSTGATSYDTNVAAELHHLETGHPIPQLFKDGHQPLRPIVLTMPREPGTDGIALMINAGQGGNE